MSQRRALVTGASEGIGRAFAKRLATDGFEITAVARNKNRLEELMTELGGTQHTFKIADLSTSQGVKLIADELTQNHHELLINNAGFGVYGEFSLTPLEKLQEMTRLNCDALVALSHAFLRRAEKGDALINVSSTLAFLPYPKNSLYAATKAFVTSFSESLWYEQKEKGVYVMDLCPGITSTGFHLRAGGHAGELPHTLTQTAEVVVENALKELKRRSTPTVISGTKNLMMASLTRLMPRKATVKIMGGTRN